MITYNGTVKLTAHVAKALLAFASKDTTRTHLWGVGMVTTELGACLAATDGHTMVTFPMVEESPFGHHGRVWPRSYVEQQIKIAAALKADVTLDYDGLALDAVFPPAREVEPPKALSLTESIGFDASYFARLALVTKACEAKGAELVTLTKPLDPVRFDVRGLDGQCARVVIMPMRI